MPKRTAATIGGAIAVTLLIAGIAWASGSDDSPSSTITPSTSTSLDDNGSSTSIDDNSTSTSLNGQTSTSIEDNTSTSSANSSTSTTIDDNTSSTIDDDDDNGGDDNNRGNDDNDDDDDKNKGGGDDDSSEAAADGARTYDVAGVATVTVNVMGGQLQLLDVQANAGWNVEVDKADTKEIKIEFVNGENKAEFEAKIEHAGIQLKVEVDH